MIETKIKAISKNSGYTSKKDGKKYPDSFILTCQDDFQAPTFTLRVSVEQMLDNDFQEGDTVNYELKGNANLYRVISL